MPLPVGRVPAPAATPTPKPSPTPTPKPALKPGPELLSAAQLARRYGVTRQAIEAWAHAGLPRVKRGGRWYYEAQAAAAFRRTHRDDPDAYANRGRAQRLRSGEVAKWSSGQVRQKAPGTGHQAPAEEVSHSATRPLDHSATSPPARPTPQRDVFATSIFEDPDAPAVPTTPEELDQLAREGRITQAGLAIADKTIALRTRMREELEAAGQLLKREDVAQAAAESLAEIRGVLLNLPARAASAAAAMFTLTPMRQAALRELLEREVDAAMLAAGGADERSGEVAEWQSGQVGEKAARHQGIEAPSRGAPGAGHQAPADESEGASADA